MRTVLCWQALLGRLVALAAPAGGVVVVGHLEQQVGELITRLLQAETTHPHIRLACLALAIS
jgi:hypothetical protein